MALKGIQVIEFAGLAPVPYCGKILRDLGARVIRIDRVDSNQLDIDRLSHGKESLAINLKNKEGIEIVKKLIKTSDVLIEPFRRGKMESLGLGPSVLCSLNPQLVYSRLTGYGQFGELSKKAGHDINYIATSGVLSCLGREKENPHAPINLLADFGGGGLMCALAILSALYERSAKTKKGKVLDCNMVEGSAYLSSWLWTSRDIPGLWTGPKGTNRLDGGYPEYETYETSDGKYMACGGLEPQFYQELLIGLNLYSVDGISKERIKSEFKKKTQKEWTAIFTNLDACVTPVLTLDEAPLAKHNAERKSFIRLADDTVLPTMNWLERDVANENFEMPLIGQHTAPILEKLGYSGEEATELEANGIIEMQVRTVKSKL